MTKRRMLVAISLVGAGLIPMGCEQRDTAPDAGSGPGAQAVRSVKAPVSAASPARVDAAPHVSAFPESETPCADAWGDLEVIFSLAKERGGDLPTLDEKAYLDACRALPPAMQQCLGLRYARAHQDRCTAAREALTEDEKSKMRSLIPIRAGAKDADPDAGGRGKVVNDED